MHIYQLHRVIFYFDENILNGMRNSSVISIFLNFNHRFNNCVKSVMNNVRDRY